MQLPSRRDAGNASASRRGPHPAVLADDVRDRFELLDDAMFAAIEGSREALAEAERLWAEVAETLDRRLVEESREQYLRYAAEVTRRHGFEPDAAPDRTLLALDVIALLAGG